MTRWLSLARGARRCCCSPAAARADGDPASDYLYTQSLFLPLDGSTPKASEAQLRALLADAKAKGYPVRVAVIRDADGSRRGAVALRAAAALRAVPRPGAALPLQGAAADRDAERLRLLLARARHDGGGEGARGAAASPSEAPDLARAAVPAVQGLAALKGVTSRTPPLAGSGSETRDRILIGVGALVVAGLVAAGLRLRRRR